MVENHPDTRKQEYRGIACLVLSAFCFALMSMFVHLAGDLPSMQKSFFRNLVAALAAVVLLLRAGEPFRIRRENLPYFLMRSIFGTMGVLCNFYAVDHLVLADASILNKMSPFFTVLFSWLILKEKVMPIQLSLIFGAFLGSIFVVKRHSPIWHLCVAAGAFSAASARARRTRWCGNWERQEKRDR